jgi:hypothetical protein
VFNADDPTDIEFLREEGYLEPTNRFPEPGMWWDCERKDLCDGFYCTVTSIQDVELTGDDPSTGTWEITVTPLTTQQGPAGADGMEPATISFDAAADSLADTVLGLIAASEDSANLLTPQDVVEWERFRSYVRLSVSPTGATFLRVTSVQSGMTFSLAVVAPAGAGGDSTNSSTTTVIATAGDSTLNVGTYVAIDRTKGTNGRDPLGKFYLKEIEASTPPSDFVGPVYLGADTDPVTAGYKFRTYSEGSMVAFAHYGVMCGYGETAIAASNIGSSPYIRNTPSGDCPTGLIIDQAGAEAGATAGVLTVTPVAADSTLYEFDVSVDGEVIGTVSYTSSAAPATADEIANVYRTQLLAINAAYKAEFGIDAYSLDAAFGSPVVLTGRADGATVALTPTAANVGDNGIVVTTPAVSTHTLFPRDKIAAASLRPGSVPVEIPHP